MGRIAVWPPLARWERPVRLAEIEDAELKNNLSHLTSQIEYAKLNDKNCYG